jgi:thioredoxin 1
MKKILRFTADWCGPCKSLAKNLSEADISGITIEVIDIDKSQETALYYGIRSVPTLVMVKDDNVIKRHTGVMTPTQLKEWIYSD